MSSTALPSLTEAALTLIVSPLTVSLPAPDVPLSVMLVSAPGAETMITKENKQMLMNNINQQENKLRTKY